MWTKSLDLRLGVDYHRESQRLRPNTTWAILSQFVVLYCNSEVLERDLLHVRAQSRLTGPQLSHWRVGL